VGIEDRWLSTGLGTLREPVSAEPAPDRFASDADPAGDLLLGHSYSVQGDNRLIALETSRPMGPRGSFLPGYRCRKGRHHLGNLGRDWWWLRCAWCCADCSGCLLEHEAFARENAFEHLADVG
jgi:hypothetical protein